MADLFLLDKESCRIFGGLFRGDIGTYYDDSVIAMGAVYDTKPAGLIMGKVHGDDFILDWLYVSEEYRDKGIATELAGGLISSLAKHLQGEMYSFTDQKEVVNILEFCGFEFPEASIRAAYDCALKDMIELPVKTPKGVRSLEELSGSEFRRMNQFFFDHPEIPMGVELPILPGQYLPLSRVVMHNNVVESLVLLREEGDILNVAYVFSGGNGMGLMGLLSSVRGDCIKAYGEEKKISICALNSTTQQLVNKVFGKSQIRRVYAGKYIEY